MKLLQKIVSYGAVMVALIAPVMSISSPALALFEDAKNQACAGANLNDTGCTANQGQDKVSNTLAAVINILSIVVGVVAVIMLIIGGIRYTTSGGDGSSTSSARNTIIYAIVGIVVAVMSQFIVKFVLGRVAK
jgi:ABC-type Fe3+ transport system permease subunit